MLEHQSSLIQQHIHTYNEMRACADAQPLLMRQLSTAHRNDESRIKHLEEQLEAANTALNPLQMEVEQLRLWKRESSQCVDPALVPRVEQAGVVERGLRAEVALLRSMVPNA